MLRPAPWETFIAAHFPGYLLPEAQRSALSEEAAARFLEALFGDPQRLFLLRAASVLSPRVTDLEELALRALPRLAEGLPRRAEVHRRAWEGRVEGRLDVTATLQRRLGGRVTEFVGRTRRREMDSPEDVLVKGVASRLLEVLGEVERSGLVGSAGWGAAVPACAESLADVLFGTALREVREG